MMKFKAKYLPATLAAMLFLQPVTFAQLASNWKSIFNGKDLSGWALTGDRGKVSVNDGCIVLNMRINTTEHTFLRTERAYSDFILELDCKRDTGFHYGILFRARDAADTAHVRLNGYQVKADHTTRHWTGGIYDDFGTTWHWMYTLEHDKRAQQAENPVGEWNHWRIEAIGDVVRIWLNGVPTAHLINKKYDAGFIALKIHFWGNDPKGELPSAWFKNIRVLDTAPQQHSHPIDIPARESI